jgi:hypothetical protein
MSMKTICTELLEIAYLDAPRYVIKMKLPGGGYQKPAPSRGFSITWYRSERG